MSDKIELTQEDLERIKIMAGQGLNVTQMAAILGMSKKTFERRMQDTPGGTDALEKGRAVAAQKVTATAFKLAVSGNTPAMTMFWLKCRQGWKETSVHELSGPDGKPIETKDASSLPETELDARIAVMLAKAGIPPKGNDGP